MVNGVLLQPLPYPESQQLRLRDSNLSKQSDSQVAPGNFIDWKRQTTVFAALEAYRTVSYNLTGDGVPERLLAGRVTSGMFRMLGAQPVLGRDFLAEEDETGREKVVLIGEQLWRRRFGSDPNCLGKTLKLSGETFTVIGVMPAAFRLPDQRERDLWTPIAFTASEESLHHAHYIGVIGRLKGSASIEQARAELNAVATRLGEQYPEANSWTVRARYSTSLSASRRQFSWVLFARSPGFY